MSYIIPTFLRSNHHTQAEFDVLRFWSGWACMSNQKKDRERERVHGSIDIKAAADANVKSKNNNDNDNDSDSDSDSSDTNEKGVQEAADAHDLPPAASQTVIRPRGMSNEEMRKVGIQVKRLFDWGRVTYLRDELNMDAKLVRYCDPDCSPECMLIIASSKTSE